VDKTEKHIINAYREAPIAEVIKSLTEAHDFLVEKSQNELQDMMVVDQKTGVRA